MLGISDRDLRDLEYAALLHDLGQISLIEPIPGGATVLAAPSDQRDIADEGARIIRHAEGLDTVADYVEAQTTPYRQVRELGEEVPMASRIIKVANAFDDLTGGQRRPGARSGRPTSASTSAWATSTTRRWSRRWPSPRRTRRWAGSGSASPPRVSIGCPAPPRRGSRGSPDARHLHRRVGIERVHRQPAGARHPEPRAGVRAVDGRPRGGPRRHRPRGRPDLAAVVAADPVGELGEECVARFGPRLPFLLKVLAPGRAISIQAHPSAEQATARPGHHRRRGLRRRLGQARAAARDLTVRGVRRHA